MCSADRGPIRCHAGHLDIAREMIDGAAGRFAGDPSLPGTNEIDWPAHVAKVEDAARAASDKAVDDAWRA